MPEKELTEVERLLARITELEANLLELTNQKIEIVAVPSHSEDLKLEAINQFRLCPFDFSAPWGSKNDATLDSMTLEQVIEFQDKFIKGAASCMRYMQAHSSDKSIKQLRAERGEKAEAKAIHERDSPRAKVGGPKLSDEAKMIRGLWRSVGPHLKREQLVAAISATFPHLGADVVGKSIDELNAKQAQK